VLLMVMVMGLDGGAPASLNSWMTGSDSCISASASSKVAAPKYDIFLHHQYRIQHPATAPNPTPFRRQ
jgi:hypothetical protein